MANQMNPTDCESISRKEFLVKIALTADLVAVGNLEEPYRWKDSVQSGDEIRPRVVDGIVHNLRPWFTKFNSKVSGCKGGEKT
jgi:hypothetical protein